MPDAEEEQPAAGGAGASGARRETKRARRMPKDERELGKSKLSLAALRNLYAADELNTLTTTQLRECCKELGANPYSAGRHQSLPSLTQHMRDLAAAATSRAAMMEQEQMER